MTVETPQADGTSIPFDISVNALIRSVHHHILLLMRQFDIELVDTVFSCGVKRGGSTHAHDMVSDIRNRCQTEIGRFQRSPRHLKWFGRLNRTRSKLLGALNPFDYVSMGAILNVGGFSGDFGFKTLKPMFVNFLMATNVLDMPASLFARCLEFFDVESATPIRTRDQGTRRTHEKLSAGFRDELYLQRPARKVFRRGSGAVVGDECGQGELFDDVVFACNANQTLMTMDKPNFFERWLPSAIRYGSELHDHAVVQPDASVLHDTAAKPISTRSNHIGQFGAWPENCEIAYIMHSQQPWADRSGKPCLVAYSPAGRIDEAKIVKRRWFQHVVHDVRSGT